ncbi:MAG: ABC transporter ATP-binding protein [Pseudochelatococcus sp.]|jgi:ABC-type glutathione transport system ATPase component|uniref:ABC transporter ATP-binding protein n=1 Tax=Pseudochelatococcus sp. TaxID=2020869 RepID=UPI003D8E09E7
MPAHPVLSIRNLTVEFELRHRIFTAVRDVSLDIAPGEVLGVVGESGAGKSMTGAAVMRLIDPPGRIAAGEIRLKGRRIDDLPEKEFAALRGKRIGMVFQDPLTSLDPLRTVGGQLVETIRAHLPLGEEEARRHAASLLEETGIPQARARLSAYPHQFSGGMRQRVVIALAIAAGPELVIADEPTSALDVSVQAQIIKVLKSLCARRGTAVLLITHDMGVIAETADRVVVMSDGRIVETGKVNDIIGRPRESYTQRLIAAIPSVHARSARPASGGEATPFVVVDALSRSFTPPGASLFRWPGAGRKAVTVVDDVSFAVARGQTFGLVGESGSGKSTIARILTGLLRPSRGTVRIDGLDIWSSPAGSAERRRKVQMIFQDPYASLNPRWRVGDIIAEPLRTLDSSVGRSEAEDRVAHLLSRVRLDPAAIRKYPHQFSGGQRQRIAIARALSSQPAFIVCDEPTSALDVSVQAQVLELMLELQKEFGLTYLLISHNLAVVRKMADRVGVLHQGVLVEEGETDAVFDDPRSDYTRMLLDAVPDIKRAADAA